MYSYLNWMYFCLIQIFDLCQRIWQDKALVSATWIGGRQCCLDIYIEIYIWPDIVIDCDDDGDNGGGG